MLFTAPFFRQTASPTRHLGMRKDPRISQNADSSKTTPNIARVTHAVQSAFLDSLRYLNLSVLNRNLYLQGGRYYVFLKSVLSEKRSLKTRTCVRGKKLQLCSPLTFLSQLPCCNIFSKLNSMKFFVLFNIYFPNLNIFNQGIF